MMTTEPRKPLNLRLNVKPLLDEDDQDTQILNTTANPLLPDRSSLLPLDEYQNHSEENEYYSIVAKICNRESMEDRFHITPFSPASKNSHSFFSVFDGHTNFYVAEYLQKHLYPTFLAQLENRKDASVQDAFKESFQMLGERIIQILTAHQLNGGSTALSAHISGDMVTLAHVGDSRAYTISKTYHIEQITKDHRFTSETERKAAQARGATVLAKGSKYLLEGSLAVSRAFGDVNYKNFLTTTPDVYELPITEEDKYLLLTTDGFWEVANDAAELQKVVQKAELEVMKASNPQTASGDRKKNLATRVVEYYVEKCKAIPKDNMAVVIIDLDYIKRTYGAPRSDEGAMKKVPVVKSNGVSPPKKSFGFSFGEADDEPVEDVGVKFDRVLTFQRDAANETNSPCKKQNTPMLKPGIQKTNLFSFS